METKEVKLKGDKVVEVRELSALEDVLSYRMVSKDFDEDNRFGGGVTVRSIQIAMSVVKENGKDVAPRKTIEDVFNFMAKYSKKDWAKITEAYFDLNEADDEGE